MSNAPFGQTPEPQAPAAQAEAQPTQPTLTDILNAVRTLNEVTNERLKGVGQDLSRIREKFKVPAGSADAGQAVAPQAQGQAQAPGLSMADLNAALALGEVRSKLPEPAKARIASMLEQGRSYSDALSFAEALAESINSMGAANAPNQPGAAIAPQVSFTGRAAMAAQSPAVGYPRTKSDLLALSKASPEKFKAVMADPNFDPDTLPMR